jgi:transcriptional regulator of acetoin/glycerol metabolism
VEPSTLVTTRAGSKDAGSQHGATTPHLFLVMECGRPFAGGARVSLDGIQEIAFGRASSRQFIRTQKKLVVGVPDPTMSSKHAQAANVVGRWMVHDAGSTNGSSIDGHRIDLAPLEDGALLELGKTLFTIRNVDTPPETPPSVDLVESDDAPIGMKTLLPAHAASLAALARVMESRLPILLLGESGTGKEMLARAAHAISKRTGAFVPVNCGAIPDTLVESQLFGHVRGAFSGAVRDEPGFVRASDRGSLFLDEIGDLPKASQAALLRVIQESEVSSIGSTRAVKVDLRVISATHRRIDTLSSEGFRADLYARLAGYVHELPPLRERREDLGVLVAAILRTIAPEAASSLAIASELGRALYAYDWPLNVRELHHTLAAAIIFAKEGKIELSHAPEKIRAPAAPSAARADDDGDDDAPLRERLVSLLAEHRGNVSEVARTMGKTRMQIHRWMKRFGVTPDDHRKK